MVPAMSLKVDLPFPETDLRACPSNSLRFFLHLRIDNLLDMGRASHHELQMLPDAQVLRNSERGTQ